LIIARRGLLARILRMLPIVLGGLVPISGGCFRSETTCYDSEAFSTSEFALRSSQAYSDVSPQGEAKRRGGSRRFRVGQLAGRRRCEVLAGPASAIGHRGLRLAAWLA